MVWLVRTSDSRLGLRDRLRLVTGVRSKYSADPLKTGFQRHPIVSALDPDLPHSRPLHRVPVVSGNSNRRNFMLPTGSSSEAIRQAARDIPASLCQRCREDEGHGERAVKWGRRRSSDLI